MVPAAGTQSQGLEFGNPLGNEFRNLFDSDDPPRVSVSDATVDCRLGFGVDFNFLDYRYFQFQINHIATLAQARAERNRQSAITIMPRCGPFFDGVSILNFEY